MTTPREDVIAKTLGAIRDLYAGNLAAHGAVSKSVGWKDAESHQLRFERLARVIDPTAVEQGFSVADWGCGYGALFGYLDRRFGAALTRYTGYDIAQPMVDAASGGVTAPNASFVTAADVADAADYVFVSGTFNVKFDAETDEWDAFVKERLAVLYSRARRGLAFNLLTSYVDWRQDGLFYADPRDFFDFCRRSLSRYVTLVHDSPLYEWTMLVHRDPPA